MTRDARETSDVIETSVSPRRKAAARRRWTAPALEALPRLTDLTLQTGGAIPGDGDTGGGGGTVF